MNDEIAYLRNRVAIEDRAARLAKSDEARAIHLSLSARYARLASDALLAEPSPPEGAFMFSREK